MPDDVATVPCRSNACSSACTHCLHQMPAPTPCSGLTFRTQTCGMRPPRPQPVSTFALAKQMIMGSEARLILSVLYGAPTLPCATNAVVLKRSGAVLLTNASNDNADKRTCHPRAAVMSRWNLNLNAFWEQNTQILQRERSRWRPYSPAFVR